MCSYAGNHNDCKTFFKNLLPLEKPRYATLFRCCDARERDCITRRKILPPHAAARLDPGIAHAVSKRKQEIRAAIGYITAVCGRVAGRATAFPFPAKAA
jgi:hypothetical protein